MKIDIRTNLDAMKRDLAKLQKDIAEKAIARAINKTVDQAKTQMTRAITAEFNLTATEVRPNLLVRRAREGSYGLMLSADLAAFQRKRGRGYNVIRFIEKKVSFAEANRRRKAGTLNHLGFRIKRGGGTKNIPGAFIGNKGRTVFKRVGKERLPIKGVTTVDVPQAFNTKRINAKVVKFIEAKFPEVLRREVAYFTSRFGK